MATIDENGKIRDGRDRKVDGTMTKLKSGRFLFNCSTCAEDFKNSKDIIGHIISVHSKEHHGDIVKTKTHSTSAIATTSTQYLVTTHSDENLTEPVLENASALSRTAQSTSNETKKRKGYTPFMDVMNEPNPMSRYNSKVRLDMIIFDSTEVKREQQQERFTPYNKSTIREQKLTIDRTKLADTVARFKIINRRKESVELVANELSLRLKNSSDRLWLANKMKSPIDKMNQQMHKINGSQKKSIKKEPMAPSTQCPTSTNVLKGFSQKDSKNAMPKHSKGLRLCRIKTEIDPTEIMDRYGINNCRKETVDFVAFQLNLTQNTSIERERLRTKMRTIIHQKKFSSESGASSASVAIKKEIHLGRSKKN